MDENTINHMSFVFFEDVLAELGHKLHFDAIVNYAGNGFMEKSWDLISEHNPFNVKPEKDGGKPASNGLAGFFNNNLQITGG